LFTVCCSLYRLGPPPAVPSMHLAPLAFSRCVLSKIKGHVVCFLLLQLQWSCSLCGSVYRQMLLESSTHQVFTCTHDFLEVAALCPVGAAAPPTVHLMYLLVIDDGTTEAHVWLSGKPVQTLLGLADSQWEGLQRALRFRGHIRVSPRGRGLVSTCLSLS
ncbi:hypothetical protein XENOCAPTIV_004931, partial [Xenoophorus captivus]